MPNGRAGSLTIPIATPITSSSNDQPIPGGRGLRPVSTSSPSTGSLLMTVGVKSAARFGARALDPPVPCPLSGPKGDTGRMVRARVRPEHRYAASLTPSFDVKRMK